MLRHSQSQQNQQTIFEQPAEAITRIQNELSVLARQLESTNPTASRNISGVVVMLQMVLERFERR